MGHLHSWEPHRFVCVLLHPRRASSRALEMTQLRSLQGVGGGGLLSASRGALLPWRGRRPASSEEKPCLQMICKTAAALREVRDAVVVPWEKRTSEDVEIWETQASPGNRWRVAAWFAGGFVLTLLLSLIQTAAPLHGRDTCRSTGKPFSGFYSASHLKTHVDPLIEIASK